MDVKKRFGADLEKKKKTFLAIGLLFSLAIVLAGFEYRTYDYTLSKLKGYSSIQDIEIEIPPVFIQKPPPPPIKKKVVTDIELVDDAEEEDPIDIESLEIEESSAINDLVPIELEEEIIVEEEAPKLYVEEMPEYNGGEIGLMQYMKNNIKYPEKAKRANRQGRVFISFVVEKNGAINEVILERGIGYGCDEEALRVVKQMPDWKPGKQLGKAVRVKFYLPISFKLYR